MDTDIKALSPPPALKQLLPSFASDKEDRVIVAGYDDKIADFQEPCAVYDADFDYNGPMVRMKKYGATVAFALYVFTSVVAPYIQMAFGLPCPDINDLLMGPNVPVAKVQVEESSIKEKYSKLAEEISIKDPTFALLYQQIKNAEKTK